jgi:hypothetical protein
VVLFWIAIVWVSVNIFAYSNNSESSPQTSCFEGVLSEQTYNNQSYQTTQPMTQSEFDKCIAKYPVHQWANAGIAIILTLILSYILQLIYYKMFIYIIFGKNNNKTVDQKNE